MAKVYIGLGSNIGDREAYLRAAIRLLKKHKDIEVKKVSSIYETEPENYTEQRKFYNLVLELKTSLPPDELLKICNFIESLLKRKREIKWGPRTIDLDILLYDELEINEENLKIPHSLMCERSFVLVPLLEIASDLKLSSGVPIKEFLDKLPPFKIKLIGRVEE
ncbi:2-amino-4-hydroxy-6-hydroxymethyldihydropteridine diphosphokinase [Candidatus Oleimmundimicrobium sp.]|uniref:2-amino-4-hydroxy-6- hydroxymethyldihydropteridine diphosphokinase n=1 Tax=Candidatus Oleimmundimicrobium sp. TaxID=3060597 RepID=UPI00271D0460|nr:2-amino-4-hydroxy-6-hydroxymethyldihydropteridine diphosphokinase [Candidatus Oleimmundimicrobium sp.]MDO8885918.1 2-amino-4-hydroxy-6-hydroxymethyldihydropteridine diphosphokinase [Candidatus Oleimmundimicrobium sp.]